MNYRFSSIFKTDHLESFAEDSDTCVVFLQSLVWTVLAVLRGSSAGEGIYCIKVIMMFDHVSNKATTDIDKNDYVSFMIIL